MRIHTFGLQVLVAVCGLHGAAQAMAPGGTLPSSTLPRQGAPVAVPDMQTGTITALRGDARQLGTQIEIAGQWLLVLNGRTVVLHKGGLVGVNALRVGQNVKFSMATLTPGETALGVVDVP